MADEKTVGETEKKETTTSSSSTTTEVKKKRQGFFSRVWNGIFRLHGDDFEKRLQYISKEEAAVLGRLKRRSQSWRRTSRNLIMLSMALEVIAVAYAIMTTRSEDLEWKMRAIRVLPMFVLPALSSAAYFALKNFNQICDRKDQKTLEKLRAERQAKIDELKERTNYYTTQQLIQKYDTDPAAKAAAATVLASKLGADSGLKVFVGDESGVNTTAGRSNDVQYGQSSGLRNRKQSHNRSSSVGSMPMHQVDEQTPYPPILEDQSSEQNQLVVDHYQPQGSAMADGGWLARIAALLVGEDPTQSYALICGNCHMHNGLARKEDFPFVTYYCPHCNALNRPKQLDGQPESMTPDENLKAASAGEVLNNTSGLLGGGDTPIDDGPVKAEPETEESKEKAQSEVVSS